VKDWPASGQRTRDEAGFDHYLVKLAKLADVFSFSGDRTIKVTLKRQAARCIANLLEEQQVLQQLTRLACESATLGAKGKLTD